MRNDVNLISEKCSSCASAVTTFADMRLSPDILYSRLSQPDPPPSVKPDTPVVELMPGGAARPNT